MAKTIQIKEGFNMTGQNTFRYLVMTDYNDFSHERPKPTLVLSWVLLENIKSCSNTTLKLFRN